ncbi:BTAD domain-containing putative transcriptional regulator [Streptomyces sp. NPDC008317]|uniref:AfsR/SARP family transcriptional regulator n=1 Tax=Streptomyces sp. NPDC008317 TaxID=3364827 RepID=UPI0036E5C0A4
MEIASGHRTRALGSSKEAHLLAALAHNVGRPIGLDTLIHRMWGDDPPGSPLSSLYANTARLRRHMAEIVQEGGGPAPNIKRRSHTYTLETAPDSVDWHRFQRLASQARLLSEDDDHQAHDLFRHAESLWYGEPLAGLSGPWAESVRSAVSERRIEVMSARIAIELRLGHFADAVAELTELVVARPTDEVLIGQLMIASHGRGLQADALRLYADLRRRLRDELGADPGPELAATHQLILSHAPVSALIPAARKRSHPVAVPQLIPQHAQLVGRELEMNSLMNRLATAGSGAVSSIQSISGMAGVGKSLMAWSAAERLADRYPDGVLHLDLCTHALTQEPLTPQTALGWLMRALGTQPTSLPDSVEELAALWRATMSRRRMVVVFDDASGPDQIRPLLPGNSPSVFLITSRRRLSGLPGVRPLVLEVLPEQDAIALFQQMIEDDRADASQEVAEIVSLCGYLPLAIEIAASRLNSRPNWSLAYLVERLSREHARIEELHDTDREIAMAFYVSYATLTFEERSVFRRISLHLIPEFGPHSAAALMGLPVNRVERAMDSLVDAHLLQAPAPERYRYHDLLAEFSLSLESAEDSREVRETALRDLVDFYTAAVDTADRMIHPERSRRDLALRADFRGRLPSWRDANEAENWLLAEQRALISAVRYAHANGLPDRGAALACVMAGFLQAGGLWLDAERIHRQAVRYWQQVGERAAEVRACIDLGTVYSGSGQYEQALSALGSAITIAVATGDIDAELEALLQVGTVHWHQGRPDAALEIQRKVLALSEARGDRRQTARCLNNLGITSLYLGRYAIAQIVLREALREFRAMGDHLFQRRVLNNMADLYIRMGEKSTARKMLEEAQRIRLPNVNKSDLVVIDITLASALDMPEQLDDCLLLLRRSLESSRELGDLRNQVICLNEMGRAYREAGYADAALGPHTNALDLSRAIGAVIEEAQSLLFLGMTERLLGHYSSAVIHAEKALELARRAHLPVEEGEALMEIARLKSEAPLKK